MPVMMPAEVLFLLTWVVYTLNFIWVREIQRFEVTETIAGDPCYPPSSARSSAQLLGRHVMGDVGCSEPVILSSSSDCFRALWAFLFTLLGTPLKGQPWDKSCLAKTILVGLCCGSCSWWKFENAELLQKITFPSSSWFSRWEDAFPESFRITQMKKTIVPKMTFNTKKLLFEPVWDSQLKE